MRRSGWRPASTLVRPRGPAGREPAGADPARRLPDRGGHARRARRRGRSHAHAPDVRARGAAQPRLLAADPARGAGRAGARSSAAVAFPLGLLWSASGSPSSPDGRTDRALPGVRVPRPAQPGGDPGSGSPRRWSARSILLRSRSPAVVAHRARGAPGRLPRGSAAARAGPGRAVRAAARASSRSSSCAAGRSPRPASGAIDPLVLAAPTLLLFGASFLALRLLLFVLRRLDGRIGRSGGLPPTWPGVDSGARPEPGSPPPCCSCCRWDCSSSRPRTARSCSRTTRTRRTRRSAPTGTCRSRPRSSVLAAIGAMPAGTTPVVRTEPSILERDASRCRRPRSASTPPPTPTAAGGVRLLRRRRLDDDPRRLETEPLGLGRARAARGRSRSTSRYRTGRRAQRCRPRRSTPTSA